MFLSISNLVHADNKEWKTGYIITNNNDTIYGLLAYRNGVSDWETCIYKKTESDAVQIFTPSQIKEYSYSEGLRYESIELNVKSKKDLYFAECLLKGKMSLYYLIINNEDPFKSYYSVDSETKRIINIPVIDTETNYLTKTRIKNRLKTIFNFNPELNKEIDNHMLNRDNLTYLFKKYNDITCSDNVCVTYNEPRRSKKMYLTPFTGFVTTFSKLEEDERSKTSISLSPIIGLKLQINTSKISDRAFFNCGIQGSSFTSKLGDGQIIKSNIVSLTFDGEYRDMQHPLKPTFECGLSFNKLFSKTYTNKEPDISGQYLAIQTSFGISVPCMKREIPIRLFYSQNIFTSPRDLGFIKNIGLSVGYRFKIK